MTRNDLTAELARLEAAAPSKVASFNEHRAARIVEIKAALAAMPAEPVRDIEQERATAAQIARFDASAPANRRADRWR